MIMMLIMLSFVDAALKKATAQPPKRSSGGFADEDDLLEL
jgi:hypothetical protein